MGSRRLSSASTSSSFGSVIEASSMPYSCRVPWNTDYPPTDAGREAPQAFFRRPRAEPAVTLAIRPVDPAAFPRTTPMNYEINPRHRILMAALERHAFENGRAMTKDQWTGELIDKELHAGRYHLCPLSPSLHPHVT